MRHTLSLLLLSLFLSSVASAKNAALENARQAQALLGPEFWSRVIKIHSIGQRRRPRPDAYALVFEFSGILWFYDFAGTQSLSRRLGELDNEKADLLPLLQAIDSGYSRFEFVEAEATSRPLPQSSIVNGCFIESIVALREQLASGEPIERARLLSYYQDADGSVVGHTVLTYETPDGAYVVDPQLGAKPTRIARALGEDARQVASSLLVPYQLVRARWIDLPVVNPAQIAGGDRGRIAKSDTTRVR